MNIETFSSLRNYAKGKITKSELMDSSDLFSNVSGRNRIPGDDIIDIEFPREKEFLKVIGLTDDDIWFYRLINSTYGRGSYEFVDSYNLYPEFEDGYVIYEYLNDENVELLSQISKFILPMKVDFDNQNYKKKLSEKLIENFKNKIDKIIDEYSYTLNTSYEKTLSQVMKDDMDNFFNGLDIDNYYDEGFNITVADLISLYLKEGYIHLPLEELLERVFSREETPGGWQDSHYDYDNSRYFDSESFNNYTSKILTEILEIIEGQGEERGSNFKDFIEMTDRVTKKFKQGVYYYLPKDPKKLTRFSIDGFEFPNMKITVSLSKGLQKRTISLSEQSLYNLLYQPSLFNLDEI
jgi:hypothetical protein